MQDDTASAFVSPLSLSLSLSLSPLSPSQFHLLERRGFEKSSPFSPFCRNDPLSLSPSYSGMGGEWQKRERGGRKREEGRRHKKMPCHRAIDGEEKEEEEEEEEAVNGVIPPPALLLPGRKFFHTWNEFSSNLHMKRTKEIFEYNRDFKTFFP